MRPTLVNYIDSLNNPNGHFKTLDTVYALRTSQGDPLFTVSSKIARFDVEWKGKRSLLCCFLSNVSTAKSRYKTLALQMESLNSKFLTPWKYLEKEILVFDERGNSKLCDVVLQQEPVGEPLDMFMRRCCKQNDIKSLQTLLTNICEMSIDFYHNGFIHGAITPNNIIITHDLTPVLINYRASHVVTSKDLPSDKVSIDNDNMALAILSIIIHIVSYQPAIYAEYRGVMIFRKPNLRKALPKLYNFAETTQIEPIKDIVNAILAANDKLKDRQLLNKYIIALSECDLHSQFAEKDLIANNFTMNDFQNQQASHDLVTYLRIEDMSEVAWASKISDTLICVKNNNNKWHYLNKDGTDAFEADFEQAEDFVEGRAVVQVYNYFGLIDRSGKYIIEPVCEDIVWHGESGIAVVSLDGNCGLRNRDGDMITAIEYEWIGDLGNGVLPAKVNDKYGYINTKGETVIKFIYDDAYSFNEGLGLVTKDGKEFEINLKGEQIS